MIAAEDPDGLTCLALEVRKMRRMQQDYFQTKRGLDQCKEQEKRVDRMADEILDPPLFREWEGNSEGI